MIFHKYGLNFILLIYFAAYLLSMTYLLSMNYIMCNYKIIIVLVEVFILWDVTREVCFFLRK